MYRLNSKTHRLWKPQTARTISVLSYLQRVSRQSVTNSVRRHKSSKPNGTRKQTQQTLKRALNNSSKNNTKNRNLSTAAAEPATNATSAGGGNGALNASGVTQKKGFPVEPPKRGSFSYYKPVPCGKGQVIDTMVSDVKVEIPKNQIQPMDGNTSFVFFF